MAQFAVRIEKSGRILIPAEIRRKLKLVGGESEILLNVDETGLIRVTTREQALERIRSAMRGRLPVGVSLADELLADRKREAAKEGGE